MPEQHERDAERHPTADDLTGAQVGHVAVSGVLAILAEASSALMPTDVQRRRGTAGLTRSAVEIQRIVTELISRAITVDRLEGATWADIAAALRMDEDVAALHYAHLDWAHLAGDSHATWKKFHRSCPAELHDFCPSDPTKAAQYLDDWYHNHADRREASPAPTRAVTAGL